MKFNLFLIVVFLNVSVFAKDIPTIVSLQWLQDNFNNPKIVIVDLREKKDYDNGHIKGAVNMPGLDSLFAKDSWMMPKLNFLQQLFGNAGIDKDSLVIAYDNGDFFWAARLYWILEVLGHENVALLKYSYGEQVKKSFPISMKPTKVVKKEFIPRVDDKQIETKLSTLMAIGHKTIIDGRAKSHYKGEDSIAKRYGHIPTAKNYACTNNFQVSKDGNYMKDFNELEKIYKDIPKDKEIVLYCQGGAESALNYIVLKKLGFKPSVYDGSWKEWGNDQNVPIENPSK